MYYNYVVGYLSSDVNSGALQVYQCLKFNTEVTGVHEFFAMC